MMNCGYDPDPVLGYDTPPIAPQMWQAYYIAGEMAAMSILAALIYRLHTGQGQALSTSVHQAVSQNTETDLPDWVYLKQVHRRVTCRHSTTSARSPSIALTKDGRYVLPYRTYVRSQGDEWDATVELLRKYGFQANLDDPKYATEYRDTDEARDRLAHQVDLLLGQTLFERDVWRDAQALNLPWTPVRRPEENVDDEHWLQRGAFFDVEHPELGRTFRYTGGKWLTEEFDWPRGPRPPLVGEHTDEVEAEWSREKVVHHPAYASPRTAEPSSARTVSHSRFPECASLT